ncbi:hypothetical protein FBQ97_05910, partial [Acidobacteria bacterium ACD]|nr:hypothetical protein [Acidobacteria bacterium ACD]
SCRCSARGSRRPPRSWSAPASRPRPPSAGRSARPGSRGWRRTRKGTPSWPPLGWRRSRATRGRSGCGG